jgi:ribosomal protein S8E
VSRYYWIRVRRVKSTNQVIHSAYYPSIVGSPLPTGILGTTARAASSAVINFSNPTPLIDRNASPVDYSATTGTVTVRIGNSLLPYDNTSPQSNFSFNIETTTETGLTAGTITVNSPNTSVSLGEASAWDGTTDSPRVTYLITVKDALGNVEEYSITQNFVLTALPGTGADGRDGVSLQLTCQPVTFVYNSNDNDYDPQSTSTLSLVVDGFTYNSQKLSFAQNTSYGDTIVDSVNPNTGETTFDSINSSTLNTINQNPVEITATISAGTYSNGTTFDVANGDDAFTVTSFIPVIANGLTGETGDDGGAGFFFIKRNDTSSTGGLGPPAVPGEVPSPEVGNVAIVENSYTASQRAVSLSAGSQVFTYDGSGTPDASPTTITTTTSNFTGTRYYEFLLDGETVKGPTTANFYDYTPPTNYQTVDEVVEVKVREGSSTAEVLASDQITLFGLESSGTDVNIVLSNETHIIPVNDSGTPTYTGSGTTIRVYRGATALIHDSLSTQSNNTFRITSVSAIGITADTIADGNNTITATFTDASNITADVASITYTINVKDSSGNNTEYTRTQILTKSKFVKPIQKAYKYTGGSPDPWEEIELIRTGVLAADAVTATQLAISNLTDVPVGKESGIFMDATNLRIQIFDQGVERIRIGKLR